MLSIDLTGAVAMITGASGILGPAIARTLAACGADIGVHCFRNVVAAEKLAADVRRIGRKAVVVQGDISDKAIVSEICCAVRNELGTVGIVVANAVSQYRWKTVLDQNVADYESQFRTSVLQVVLLAQELLPEMIERRSGGRFIAINTECTVQCHPHQSAYVAGKRGMDGVLRVLAREVGQHSITVNQVAPGWILADGASPSETELRYAAGVPLQRQAHTEDVAGVVAFLASNLASHITGALIPVCGGNVMTAL